MANKKFNSPLKLFLIALIILVILIISVLGWFVWQIASDTPPHFFPLGNADAVYTVTKNCPHGQGWNDAVGGEGDAYCVEYKGTDVFMNDQSGNSNFFRITVGNSKVDLEPLNGVRVKDIEGDFVTSSQQCIQGKCINIGGPFVVLDIDSLERYE